MQDMSGGGLARRFGQWSRRLRLTRILTILLAVAAALSCIATYGALTRLGPFVPDTNTIIVLLNIDLVLLLLLGALIARRLASLWYQHGRSMVGTRLHGRLVAAFSLAAAVPAILVGISSMLFFNLGIDAWFSERVQSALARSAEVAETYVEDHIRNLRAHVAAMAWDIDRLSAENMADEVFLSGVLDAQANLRGFSEAIVIRDDGQVLGKSRMSFSLSVEPVPKDLFRRAQPNTVVVLAPYTEDRVRAMIPLKNTPGAYLYIGRLVDKDVLGYAERVASTVREYQNLEGGRSNLQIVFALVYGVAALLMLFVAVWFALQFASRIVRPVTDLVSAAERVRQGDLTARVAGSPGSDELALLSDAFNRMTGQIEAQRHELVETNEQLDTRRRFTESVLSGVSAGVVGLDGRGVVELPNLRALELLGVTRDELVGQPLARIVPEVADLLEEAMKGPPSRSSGNIEVVRGGSMTSLMVRISLVGDGNGDAADDPDPATGGCVVTFDDVTPLVRAQRKAAWSDVARRVAHEIRNPLTPIKLAAERLNRKFLPQVGDAPDIFRSCTDTIVRQVDDLSLMVDEFSEFARLPTPNIAPEDAVDLVDEAMAFQEAGQSRVVFERAFPETRPVVACDRGQMTRVLNNIIKNALEAIEDRDEGESDPGLIRVSVAESGRNCMIRIRDNGCGLPAVLPAKLLEPYETYGKKGGTGLGLPIVQSILDEHRGTLDLADNTGAGACVTITLPLAEGQTTGSESG